MERNPDQRDASQNEDQDEPDLEAAGSLARQRPATHRHALLSAQKRGLGLIIEVEHAGVERRFVEAARTYARFAYTLFEFIFLRY